MAMAWHRQQNAAAEMDPAPATSIHRNTWPWLRKACHIANNDSCVHPIHLIQYQMQKVQPGYVPALIQRSARTFVTSGRTAREGVHWNPIRDRQGRTVLALPRSIVLLLYLADIGVYLDGQVIKVGCSTRQVSSRNALDCDRVCLRDPLPFLRVEECPLRPQNHDLPGLGARPVS